MPITPLFAAIFAFIYVVLSATISRQRLSKKIGHGSGGDRDLENAIRTHGNFAEYVPLCLLMLWFLETITYNHTLALILASGLLVARIAHIIGMRDPKNYLILRQFGALATLAVLLASAVSLIWHYLPF